MSDINGTWSYSSVAQGKTIWRAGREDRHERGSFLISAAQSVLPGLIEGMQGVEWCAGVALRDKCRALVNIGDFALSDLTSQIVGETIRYIYENNEAPPYIVHAGDAEVDEEE